MQLNGTEIVFSPSDFTQFLDSPFASWMDRFCLHKPEVKKLKDPRSDLFETLSKNGIQHEIKIKDLLISEGFEVKIIEGDSFEDKYQNTILALKKGYDVIYQAHLNKDNLIGASDFLIKKKGKSNLGDYYYEIWDSKLSNTVKPSFIIQLCAYAEMLQVQQGTLSPQIGIYLGNFEKKQFNIQNFYFYYLSIKDDFIKYHDEFDMNQMPNLEDSKAYGEWNNYVSTLLLEKDDLLQIAGITKGQVKKLKKHNIVTFTQLLESNEIKIPGIQQDIFAKLKAQADIQNQTKKIKQLDPNCSPAFKVIPPNLGEKKGLALLPPPSKKDVFFDIEGFPLTEGGLEYLWGATYFDQEGQRQFIDFWAHNQEEEKIAFQQFIVWVYERWVNDPNMHIYHYANYEIAACRKLMGRYNVCEKEVDNLLRHNVFVDLYKVVKTGLLIGEPKYSIKNVEHLYRGKRETEVENGGDSVVVYENWRSLFDNGLESKDWRESEILADIRNYNIDDCNSTQELYQWLFEQQKLNKISFVNIPSANESLEGMDEELDTLKAHLLKLSKDDSINKDKQNLSENLSGLLTFHKRENKPVWWKFFDRLSMSHYELYEDFECLANCNQTDVEPYKPSKRGNPVYEYHFDTSQDFKGIKSERFFLHSEFKEDGKNISVSFKKDLSDLNKGIIAISCGTDLPKTISLIPDEIIGARVIEDAISRFCTNFSEHYDNEYRTAVLDFFLRRSPNFKHEKHKNVQSFFNNQLNKNHNYLDCIIESVKHLDNSYLVIQGPPGAGKTYTGKHIIGELLRDGQTIAISSNSHKAINHLLVSTKKYCDEHKILGNFYCTKDTGPEILENNIEVLKSTAKIDSKIEEGVVIGSTAWGFSRAELDQKFDYLFIDEAGQVSIANLIGMGQAARNIILMGDQMQLGQPIQGSHPFDNGKSTLDYLLECQSTISPDMGIFLDTTYRMHSAINQFISKFIYDSKLLSHPDNDLRLIKDELNNSQNTIINKVSGICYVPVKHEGNSQASLEEAKMIEAIVQELLKKELILDKKKKLSRKISIDDFLFISPYNHQVNILKNVLGEGAKIGSVDKFQGQEAPIVILSMCASNAEDSPRGVDFLFDKNRLNVAISRAKCLAIIVANPKLQYTKATQLRQLELINTYNALIDYAKN